MVKVSTFYLFVLYNFSAFVLICNYVLFLIKVLHVMQMMSTWLLRMCAPNVCGKFRVHGIVPFFVVVFICSVEDTKFDCSAPVSVLFSKSGFLNLRYYLIESMLWALRETTTNLFLRNVHSCCVWIQIWHANVWQVVFPLDIWSNWTV